MEARSILARAGAAELALSEFGTLKRGTLCVRASQTIAGHWLPRHLVAFQCALIPAFGYSAPHPSAGGTLTLLFIRCPAHTTNLSATPGRPACPSRASGWFRAPRLGASRISYVPRDRGVWLRKDRGSDNDYLVQPDALPNRALFSLVTHVFPADRRCRCGYSFAHLV